MARIHHVKSARKPQGNCSKCGKAIEVGDAYKWTAPRASKASRGWKKKACSTCSFRTSDTMSSPHLGALADAQEDFDTAVGQASSVEDLQSAAETLAESIRQVGEGYTESADNMESGFGTSTYISDEIREKGDGCESWADEVESAASDLDEFDEDDARTKAEEEVDGNVDKDADDFDQADYDQQVEDEIERLREEHLAEQLSELEQAAYNQPF
jgi:hypothetical protein